MKSKNIKIILFLFLCLPTFNANSFSKNIELLFPSDGQELTNVAVSFKAKISVDGPYYIWISKFKNFSGNPIKHLAHTDSKGISKDSRNVVYFLVSQGKIDNSEKFMLEKGTWYWKIVADNGKEESETRKVIVNDVKLLTKVTRTISPEKPLFHMRLRGTILDNTSDPDKYLRQIVPPEWKDYVVLDLGQSFSHLVGDRSLYEYSKVFNDLGYKFFYDLGCYGIIGRIASLGEMEEIFQKLPNCVGASTAEVFYHIFFEDAAKSMFDGTLELCRKYGKFFLLGDMNWMYAKWQMFNYEYYDEFNKLYYQDYFLPTYKTTDPWGGYTCISALQGMKLTGMVKNFGVWSDMWCWEKFGDVNTFDLNNWSSGNGNRGDKKFPFIQNIKQYIYGITYGSTVFALEPNLQWSNDLCEPNDNFYRYLKPFVNAVIEEHLIPSVDAIQSTYNVILNTEFESSKQGNSPALTYKKGNIWGDFLRSTYGISNINEYNNLIPNRDILESAYLEMFPNSDRYPCGIPFLPKPGVDSPTVNGKLLNVVDISELNTKEKVDNILNKDYPETGNEAYARMIDSSFFVFNNYENNDIKEKYNLKIGYYGINEMYGEVALMSYVIGRIRRDGKTVFFQTNAHVKNSSLIGGDYSLPTYNSILHFKCNKEPVFYCDKSDAIVSKKWDEESKVLTIEIDHTSAGAVNFCLGGDSYQDLDKISSMGLKIVTYSDSFQIIGLVKTNIPFKVYNTSGKEMYKGKLSNDFKGNLKSLKDGLYLVTFYNDGIPLSFKILKK